MQIHDPCFFSCAFSPSSLSMSLCLRHSIKLLVSWSMHAALSVESIDLSLPPLFSLFFQSIERRIIERQQISLCRTRERRTSRKRVRDERLPLRQCSLVHTYQGTVAAEVVGNWPSSRSVRFASCCTRGPSTALSVMSCQCRWHPVNM